ncbi:Pentatricopeptide repeat, partial [Dillenia turbinata]
MAMQSKTEFKMPKYSLGYEKQGFIGDQVILTAMVDMYSKSGNLKLAEETFKQIILLGQPLDRKSYGSIIMAYIKAGMPDQGESLIREMEAQDMNAGSEVFKALLSAYSMTGDSEGAQREKKASELLVAWFNRLGVVQEVEKILRQYASEENRQ